MLDLQIVLDQLGACQPAKNWLYDRSFRVTASERKASFAWKECNEPHWLIWIAARSGSLSKMQILRVVIRCLAEAETNKSNLLILNKMLERNGVWPNSQDVDGLDPSLNWRLGNLLIVLRETNPDLLDWANHAAWTLMTSKYFDDMKQEMNIVIRKQISFENVRDGLIKEYHKACRYEQ